MRERREPSSPSTRAKAILALAAGLAFPLVGGADDEDVIDYREHIMNTLEAQTSAVGQILSMAIPDDNLVTHLETIALTASTALKAFEPKVEGGEAKPEVWAKWADFSKRMNEFATKTAQVAKSAKEKGPNPEQILDALDCKGCHDVYRVEKKKK